MELQFVFYLFSASGAGSLKVVSVYKFSIVTGEVQEEYLYKFHQRYRNRDIFVVCILVESTIVILYLI